MPFGGLVVVRHPKGAAESEVAVRAERSHVERGREREGPGEVVPCKRRVRPAQGEFAQKP